MFVRHRLHESAVAAAALPAHCYELCQAQHRCFPFFYYMSFCFLGFPFPTGRSVFKRSPGWGNGQAIAHPAIRARPGQGRHQLTHRVIARKRARPISKSGRCQPQCGCGRAPFQIVSVDLWHGFTASGYSEPRSLDSGHFPIQLSGLDLAGLPAPQIDGQLAGHGHDGLLAFGSSGFGIAQ